MSLPPAKDRDEECNDCKSEFADYSISPHDVLRITERKTCPRCQKKRRYLCAECSVPLIADPSLLPRVTLPLHVDILQASAEVPQRSTAQHIPLLAPDHSRVWRPYPECGERFRKQVLDGAPEGTVAVLYPSETALLPEEALSKLPNLKRVIVIDSTWTKSVLLASEPLLAGLPRLTLPPGGGTRFWRFCDAYSQALGHGNGSCDDLLWLFSFLHGRVRQVYEKAPGKRQRIMRKSKGLLQHL